MRIYAAMTGLVLAACGQAQGRADPRQQPELTTAQRERIEQAVRDEIQSRIDRKTDPAADAAEAARRGQYGLITLGRFGALPEGATCFTPYGEAPRTLYFYRHGDVFDEQQSAWYRYSRAYNRALVERPDYPDADLCRTSLEADVHASRRPFAIALPAREVATPPRTLHEAARRGRAADVRRLLVSGPVDDLDGLGMTPLAWAVARENKVAFALLLKAGANPWAGDHGQRDALFWAAVLGRRSWFGQLQSMPRRPFEKWPSLYLAAAMMGGDPAIVASILAQPHDPARFDLLQGRLPPPSLFEPVLRDNPALAEALLWEASDYPNDRPDLIALALAHGADPNSTHSYGRYGTLLGTAANGIGDATVEIVDLLLKAGADPNLMSHRERPIWMAVGILKLDGKTDEVDVRAIAIFRRLLAAGADLNLPNDEGVPPVRLLLFPYRGAHDRLDAGFVTPALLDMLVKSGLDLNAEWQGKRVLPMVEAQAGRDSELAVTLRRLGAR